MMIVVYFLIVIPAGYFISRWMEKKNIIVRKNVFTEIPLTIKKSSDILTLEVKKEKLMSETNKVELTNSALSLVRTGNTLQVIRIRFNPKTKEVGEVEIIGTEDNQRSGEERFKIFTVKEGIIS